MSAPRVWPVFVVYVLAVVGILVFSLLAASVLGELYPDLPPAALFDSLPGLLAGAIASSTALLVMVMAVTRPLDPARLRLCPGRETGRQLAVMILGVLALGQALDSATALAGLDKRGALAVIRRLLERAEGPELFAAVIVIGVIAGAAEEIFFRGYMLARLGERWPPVAAVVVTSLAFALLHGEWVHATLALALGLYLGFITVRAGSALPAVTAHVVNNVLFTVLTATVGPVAGVAINVMLGLAGVLVFAACVVWLHRGLR